MTESVAESALLLAEVNLQVDTNHDPDPLLETVKLKFTDVTPSVIDSGSFSGQPLLG